MSHRLEKAFLAWCLFAWPAMPAQAQCADGCKWSDRGDRWEGLFDEPVASGRFDLWGLHYRSAPETAAAGEQLYLTFWLPPSPELVEVEVWQPTRQYRMRPAREQYGAGRQQFTWPRGEVVGPLGLSIEALYARIQAGAVYIPALLSTREAPKPAPGYAFIFDSGAGIDAVCTIARRDEKVVRRFECFEDYGGTIVIEWDGRDDRGQPVAEGVYVLKLDGEMLGETMRPLPGAIPFWHRGPFE